ncbi:hypothetical protein PO603_23680 [Escherichia coli]
MAFIPPTIDDVRHCSNALSVDPAETDAARAIARVGSLAAAACHGLELPL